MKNFRSIYPIAVALTLATACMTSCSDNEDYDFPGDPRNKVFNMDQSASFSIINSPMVSSTTTDFDISIPVKCTKVAKSDINVTFGIDNSLIDAYNEEHGTSYVALPSEALIIDKESVIIPQGQRTAEHPFHASLTTEKSVLATFDSDYGYLIPVRMTGITGNEAQMSSNLVPVSYFILTKTDDNILHKATETAIKGTRVADQSGWTATTNATMNGDAISCILDGDASTYKSFQNRDTDMVIDIDMGKQYTFDALTVYWGMIWSGKEYNYGQLSTFTSFEFSNDATNWYNLGNFTLGDSNMVMVFRAPISARYIRLTVQKRGAAAASLQIGSFNIYAL